MSRNNPVFQVLIPTANTAALTVGNPVSALAPGQIGFFNEQTNLSINVATPELMNNFYIAVGVDSNGDGTTDDVVKSAGQYIQRRLATNLTARCYLAPRVGIWDITDFKASCDSTYGIRFNVHTGAGQTIYGPNDPLKTFVVQSGCCGPCATCGTGNASEVALNFVNDINADVEKLFKADLLDYTTTPGTPVVVPISGYAAWVAANSHLDPNGETVYDAGLGIRITGNAEKISTIMCGGLLNKYDFPRGVILNIALIEGFHCTGKVTIVQTPLYEQGAGVDVAQMEYDCAGHNGGGNYRQSELTGFFFPSTPKFASASGKYVLFTLTNDFESNAGHADYRANLETTIAVPCANATALTSIAAYFDGIFAGMFEPVSALVATCDCAGLDGEISALNNPAADGIAIFQ
jgi:hypothetical protein